MTGTFVTTRDLDLDPLGLPVFEEDVRPERTASMDTTSSELVLPREPYLLVVAGAHEGTLFKLVPGATLTLGRADDCELRLEDDGISRKHARFVVRDDGVDIEDLQSRNGTFVGAERIMRKSLAPGDLVRVGARTVIKYARMDAMEEECQRRLVQAALRDSLTGLYNRRHLDERLAGECASAKRHGKPLALALFDLDNFKKVNDTYGHVAGDDVLVAVARSLVAGARREDVVFRYGGEEMAVLLPDTTMEGALQAAERRREDVARLGIRIENGTVLRVTMSGGVAEFAAGIGEAELIERADAALYRAKRSGKNRVLPWRSSP